VLHIPRNLLRCAIHPGAPRTYRRRQGVLRASLRYSMADGICGALAVGLIEAFIVPYGLALKATPAQIGYLAAVPGLIAALMQIHAPFLSGRGLKTPLRWIVGLQAGTLLFLAAVPGFSPEQRFPLLLTLVTTYMIFASLASPLYGTLLAEHLPSARRSGYFGWRYRVLGYLTVTGSLIAGLVLDHFGKESVRGFSLLFLAAGICRVLSRYYIGYLHEPGKKEERRVQRRELGHAPLGANFIRFVIFAGLFMGAVNLAAPFFPIYLLQDLSFPYRTYTLLVIGSQATMFYLMGVWGREADQVGNLKVIKSASMLMPLLPLLWIATSEVWFLFCVQILGGAFWSGYNLCITNFIYDAVASFQRVRATVLFNLSSGIGSFAGASMGGQLLIGLPAIHGQRFYSLALFSAALQVLILIYFLPRLKEVRSVPAVRSLDLFYSVLNIRPVFAAIRNGIRFTGRDD
jgi:MFS family permease